MTFKKMVSVALFVVFTAGCTNAYAKQDFLAGLSVRYNQFVDADTSSNLIALGLSVKLDQWALGAELGGSDGETILRGSNDEYIGELDAYVSTSVGYEKSLMSKVALGGSITFGNYIISSTTSENNAGTFTFVTTTETRYVLEPRVGLVLNITDKIDFSLFGGILLGADSLSEPTAGGLLRLHFF